MRRKKNYFYSQSNHNLIQVAEQAARLYWKLITDFVNDSNWSPHWDFKHHGECGAVPPRRFVDPALGNGNYSWKQFEQLHTHTKLIASLENLLRANKEDEAQEVNNSDLLNASSVLQCCWFRFPRQFSLLVLYLFSLLFKMKISFDTLAWQQVENVQSFLFAFSPRKLF